MIENILASKNAQRKNESLETYVLRLAEEHKNKLNELIDFCNFCNSLEQKKKEIVHCKDCKWWVQGKRFSRPGAEPIYRGVCHEIQTAIAFTRDFNPCETFYCSHGERKEQ